MNGWLVQIESRSKMSSATFKERCKYAINSDHLALMLEFSGGHGTAGGCAVFLRQNASVGNVFS